MEHVACIEERYECVRLARSLCELLLVGCFGRWLLDGNQTELIPRYHGRQVQNRTTWSSLKIIFVRDRGVQPDRLYSYD
jgi:hypothetical protein